MRLLLKKILLIQNIIFQTFCLSYQQCNQGQFFNLIKLQCEQCPLNMLSLNNQCYCDENSITQFSKKGIKNSCQKCPKYEIANNNHSLCQKCQNNNCQCNEIDEIRIFNNYDGSLQEQVLCQQCIKGFKADKQKNLCYKMENGAYIKEQQKLCENDYELINDFCFLKNNIELIRKKFDIKNLSQISINDKKSFKSEYLEKNIEFYIQSCLMYEQKTLSYCFMLYKFCLLQQFDKANIFCQLYDFIYTIFPQKNYQNKNLLLLPNIEQKIYPLNLNQNPEIYLVEYSSQGLYQNINLLDKSDLICNFDKMRINIGINKQQVCSYSIKKQKNENFYSLFIKDKMNQLHLIPVKIQNLENKNQFENLKEQILYYSFYLFNKSIYKFPQNSYINYAKNLTIQFIKENEQYNVYLQIQYELYEQEQLDDHIKFELEQKYQDQNSQISNIITIIYGIIYILIVFLSICKCIVWSKNNPDNNLYDFYFLYMFLNWIFIFAKVWAYVILGYIIIFSILLYLFYNFSFVQIFIFPNQFSSQQIYTGFQINIYIIFVIFIFVLIQMMFEICQTKIILLDWEKNKIQLEIPNSLIDENETDYKEGQQVICQMQSAWRQIIIGNELFELSIQRRIQFEFVILTILTINQYYELDQSKQNFEQNNMILNFGRISLLSIIVGYVFYLKGKIFELIFGSKFENFLDLLSLSNISVLLFDSSQHAFYIHGENNTGCSEVNFSNLQKNLEKEKKGFLGKRGLLSYDQTELQTFEVQIPLDFENFLNNLYHREIKNQIQQKLNANLYQNQQFNFQNQYSQLQMFQGPQEQQLYSQNMYNQSKTKKQNFLSKLLNQDMPLNLNYKKLNEGKKVVQNAFKMFLQKVNQKQEGCITKTLIQKLLGLPVINLKILYKKLIFIRDDDLSLEKVFFYGQEIKNLFINFIKLDIKLWLNI